MFKFSRKQLQWLAIIIVCTIAILRWPEQESSEPQYQPPAPLAYNQPTFQAWLSREQVPVIFMPQAGTELQILVSSIETPSSQASVQLGTDIETAISQLSLELEALTTNWQGKASQLMLTGPWLEKVAQLVAAKTIKQLNISASPKNNANNSKQACSKYLLKFIQHDAVLNFVQLVDSQQHQQWQQQVKQHVMSEQFHIDFAFNLTYYRCPQKQWQTELNQLYLLPLNKLQAINSEKPSQHEP